MEFCEWIGRTKKRKIVVITTKHRPVPLQHYLFHDDEAYLLLHAESHFDSAGYAAAAKHVKEKSMPKVKKEENAKMSNDRKNEKLQTAAKNAGVSANNLASKQQAPKKSTAPVQIVKPGSASGTRSGWLSLIKILQAGGREESGGLGPVNFGEEVQRVISKKKKMELAKMDPYESLSAEFKSMVTRKEYEEDIRLDENEDRATIGLLPAVVFSFSKSKCEEIAEYLSGIDLLTANEKKKVKVLVTNISKRLNPLDASLPQLLRLQDMLIRGIGIHHGGLLPILKELVELLFAQGVTKILFATETFAMVILHLLFFTSQVTSTTI